jgi:hypothetical protein
MAGVNVGRYIRRVVSALVCSRVRNGGTIFTWGCESVIAGWGINTHWRLAHNYGPRDRTCAPLDACRTRQN